MKKKYSIGIYSVDEVYEGYENKTLIVMEFEAGEEVFGILSLASIINTTGSVERAAEILGRHKK